MTSAMGPRFLTTYNLRISTLSPVHIGCGEDYEPTNYVISDSMLHGFDVAALIDALDESGRKKLNDLLNQRDPLLGMQAFMNGLTERLLPYTTHSIEVSSEVESYYERRVGKLSNTATKGSNDQNKLEIARTAFNPVSQRPIIPGSSLKGSIRTALLNALNDKKPTRLKPKELEHELLGGSFSSDPLRLLKISDAGERVDDSLLARRVMFENNVKRVPSAKATQRPMSFMREVLPSINYQMFDAALTLNNLCGAKLEDRKGSLVPYRTLSLSQIVKACNAFYGTQLSSDLRRLEERGCLDQSWLQLMKQLLNGPIAELTKAGSAMLLRVGRHSGAESVTIEGVRSIKVKTGKNQSVQKDHATTDWLAGDRDKMETGLIPFGWILLEIDPSTNNPASQELQALMHAYTASGRARQRELLARMQQTRDTMELERKRILELERERELKRIAEEQAEAEKAAVRAAKSEEDRIMDDLLDRMTKGEDKGRGAGSTFARDVTNATEAAASWPLAHKERMAVEVLKLLEHLKIDRKNDKWKKRLNALKG